MNKVTPNIDIRQKIVRSGLRYWQVAEAIGITAGTFTLWLRTELSDERRKRVETAIDSLLEED